MKCRPDLGAGVNQAPYLWRQCGGAEQAAKFSGPDISLCLRAIQWAHAYCGYPDCLPSQQFLSHHCAHHGEHSISYIHRICLRSPVSRSSVQCRKLSCHILLYTWLCFPGLCKPETIFRRFDALVSFLFAFNSTCEIDWLCAGAAVGSHWHPLL